MPIDGPAFDISTQAVGFLGLALNVVMRAMTVDRRLKLIGAVAATVWTLHFVLLRAWVGATCNAIEGVVILLSLAAVPSAGRWLLAALPLLPAPWIVASLSDMLPIVSAVSCGFGMLFCEGVALRLILLLTTGLWLVYDLANGSLGGTLTELLSIATLLATLWRMQPRPAKQEQI